MIHNVLSIAGSDPSGGAGIQADLKTFSALGCYGMAAMTAMTAQNTRGVQDVHDLPTRFVVQQVQSLIDDIRIDAVKVGMAGNPETIIALADLLQKYHPPYLVIDPVMVAQSGDALISDEAIGKLRTHLVPLASVLTPNIPEAEILLGRTFENDMEDFAKRLLKLGPRAVLLKGGHLTGPTSKDVYADQKQTRVFELPRVATRKNHGTGCTLSSALTCYLARGLPVEEAAEAAKRYVTGALQNADKIRVGNACGPVHHFFAVWK